MMGMEWKVDREGAGQGDGEWSEYSERCMEERKEWRRLDRNNDFLETCESEEEVHRDTLGYKTTTRGQTECALQPLK